MGRLLVIGSVPIMALAAACNFVSADKGAKSSGNPDKAPVVAPSGPAGSAAASGTDGPVIPAAAATSPGDELGEGRTGFYYDYPAALVGAVKGLGAYLAAEKNRTRADFDQMVADYDPQSVIPADALTSQTRWSVASQNPTLLILNYDHYSYGGGAHGMGRTGVLLWDKEKNTPVKFLDLFADKQAARSVLTPAFCAMLDAERSGRRGERKPQPGVGEETPLFWDCPPPFEDPDAVAVWPAGGATGTYTRLHWSIAPYVAGPYAEGQYTIETAIPAKLVALIKPEYRALFGGER